MFPPTSSSKESDIRVIRGLFEVYFWPSFSEFTDVFRVGSHEASQRTENQASGSGPTMASSFPHRDNRSA
jgi:hypothetical protein